jgi:phage shock protein PspC (stress-responsive transcriptional regulator)
MTEYGGNAAARRLTRNPADGKLGGVCAGLAEYFDVDVVLVRVAWVVLSIWPGAIVLGALAYIAAWVLMPRSDLPLAATRTRLFRSRLDRRIGGVCGGLAEYFDVDPTIVRLAWVVVSILAGAVVFGVVAYLIAWFVIPVSPAAALHTSPSIT